MKSHTIIGTAGHIDHGKTTLVRALTGINTDRLKDEQTRGMTIDIGFAHWQNSVTIIDVPGHERFIRNMVAGVSTIDYFLFVIAADDGIMPQTIEHLDILNVFNIRNGLVAITKIDMVDQEWLTLVQTEVRELFNRYHLPHVQIFPVSSTTGTGIDKLKNAIQASIGQLQDSIDNKPFRMAIDRSFTMKGFGTIVTGTVLSGSVEKGEQISLLPHQRQVVIRGMQRHIQDVDSVGKGDRAAINLQGIAKDEITRGDQLVSPDTLIPVKDFIGQMHTVSKLPYKIKNNCKVTVHSGTAVRNGRLFWYDEEKYLVENRRYHIRTILSRSMPVTRNDAYLIRLHSPVITLGGGMIFEVMPANPAILRKEWQSSFSVLQSDQINDLIEYFVKSSNYTPVSDTILKTKLFENTDTLHQAIKQLTNAGKIIRFVRKGTPCYLHNTIIEEVSETICTFLKQYHVKNPDRSGANMQELLTETGYNWFDSDLTDFIIQRLVKQGQLKRMESTYALPAFKAKQNENFHTLKEKIAAMYHDAAFSPPSIEELAGKLELKPQEISNVCKSLERENVLIYIRIFYLHTDIFNKLIAFIKRHFQSHTTLNVIDLKNYLNTSRKYTIPVLEYLDLKQYTQRRGDLRIAGNLLN